MLATRIGAAAMLLTLAACADGRQFSAVPVPPGSVVGSQPVATSHPIVLYPARPGLGQSAQPATNAYAPLYGYGYDGSVARAPEVVVEPLDNEPGLGAPPISGGSWVLPD
jgi:hypothetical protein